MWIVALFTDMLILAVLELAWIVALLTDMLILAVLEHAFPVIEIRAYFMASVYLGSQVNA